MTKRLEQAGSAALSFVLLLFYTAILLFTPACSHNTGQKPAAAGRPKKQVPPVITLLSGIPESAGPKVTLLDTVPGPEVKNVTGRAQSFSQSNRTTVEEKRQGNPNGGSGKMIAEASGIGFFTSYTTDDGLTLDQINCSYKDKWGALWFGTNGGGVSKYDGKNFTTYTTANGLASNVIWCITQDHEGNLWFGTDGNGASKYDGESFTNYNTARGLPGNVIFSIVEDKANNLWFGTLNGGVSKWDGRAFTNYSTKDGLANDTVKSILQDSKGNLWFATLGGGISKWGGKTFINYTAGEGLTGNRVLSISEDHFGNLWFGTDGKGLTKYDGKIFTKFELFSGRPGDAVQCMAEDKQGILWLGTRKSGMIKYDGNVFTSYSTANGLPGNQIKTITEDETGNLWLGTFGGGICKFAGNSFTNFTTAHGLPNNVIFSIEEDDESNLWFVTSGDGVCRYDGKRFTNFRQTDGLARDKVYCVLKDRAGNLWFGTSGGGVSKYDGKRFTNYTTLQGLANNIVFSIVEDRKGNLWFGTSGGGVSKFDGRSFTNYTKAQGLAGDVVFSSKEDGNGALWFGTLGGGISKFDGAGFTNYTVEQGLSDNVVWTIATDRKGNLWAGTQKGLSLMRIEKANQTLANNFTSFTTDDGLPDNFITQVVQGSGDTLYVGTNLGICELLPSSNGNLSGPTWSVGRIFNIRHGYPVKDVNAGLNAMFKDSKGIIWTGTGSDKTGLVRFDPSALKNSSGLSPTVFINQLQINNKAVSWRSIQKKADDSANDLSVAEEMTTIGRRLTDSERDSLRFRFGNIRFDSITKWQPLPQKLVLPYYFNNVSFAFGVVETGKNLLVNYQYILEGYDREWSPVSRNTSVNFGNINEGSYVFKVKAQSPDGVWGDVTAYGFKVLPPWWRTWWMFVLYSLLITASILLFFSWKNKRIIYKQKILERRIAIATKKVREEAEKVQVQKKKAEDALKELKETQTQLIHSEKMASLGELTAGIAHEIQNPLNFVTNFSEVSSELIVEMKDELLKGNYGDVDTIAKDVKQNLEKINHHGKRAAAIVKGMLQHSRTSNGQKEETDINALCDEYMRLSYQGLRAKDKSFNATIKTDFDESAGTINVVQQDIGRVILNLLTNAFYAVNEKKKTVGESYQPTVSVQTKKLTDKVEISVSDNGNGIPQKIADKIFQPFFTTKPTGQGTGLGLSLAYDIVKTHGGEIKVDTADGEGTIFIICLNVPN